MRTLGYGMFSTPPCLLEWPASEIREGFCPSHKLKERGSIVDFTPKSDLYCWSSAKFYEDRPDPGGRRAKTGHSIPVGSYRPAL